MSDARVEHTATRLRNGKVLGRRWIARCPQTLTPAMLASFLNMGRLKYTTPRPVLGRHERSCKRRRSNHTATLRNDGMGARGRRISEMIKTAFVATTAPFPLNAIRSCH